MKENIQDILIQAIKESLKAISFACGLSKGPISLDVPCDSRFGDFSTNIALRLAKELKAPPRELAAALTGLLEKSILKHKIRSLVSEIKVEGAGFINFYLSDGYFYGELKSLITEGKAHLRRKKRKQRNILIEFVSANPTGPLSVAHARQAVVGDVLANVFDFTGFELKREYYLNDEGNQINILTDSVNLRLKELSGENIEYPENYYQGDYIRQIAQGIKSQETPALSSACLPAGQAGKVKSLEDYVVKYILDIIKKELDDLGVKFDNWFSQKELKKSAKIDKALDFLKKRGFLYEQDGAVWFASTKFGDDKDRVVIKSDGSFTYLAPDIAYHGDKYRRGFNYLINLWGPDHHGYIGRLKSAVQALGYDPGSLSIVIVQLATIFRDGKTVEMSTRRGQYITLREVLDEVGKDAARFFFLMRKTSSHLDFDLAVAKKQTSENPVYYVQYAYARICSILRSAEVKINLKTLDLSVLKEKEELQLIKKSLELPYILDICVATEDPYMITIYLQQLAESFHKFYDLHRVLGQEAKLTQARLALLEGVKIVFTTGLELLGVSLPERM